MKHTNLYAPRPLRKLSRRQFIARVTEQARDGLITVEERNEAVRTYLTAKERARREKIRKTMNRAQWDRVLEPLNAEINSTRSSIAYAKREKKGADYIDTYRAYLGWVTHVKMCIGYCKSWGYSIAEGVAWFEKCQNTLPEGKHLPNEGKHWTDWVAPNVKREFQQAFDALPAGNRPRRMPFERKMPPEIPKNTDPFGWHAAGLAERGKPGRPKGATSVNKPGDDSSPDKDD